MYYGQKNEVHIHHHLLLQFPDVFLTLLLCVQLQRAVCVTRCVQTRVAGAPGPTSVSPVGTTAETAHVWAAVTSTPGQ